MEDTSTGPYKRKKRARVIRSVHFNIDTDPEKHYREKLMLYNPWRDEHALKCNFPTYSEAYQHFKDTIEEQQKIYEPFSDTVDEAKRLLNENEHLEEMWDELAPQT